MPEINPKVKGPHSAPSSSDLAQTRTEGHKAGLAAKPGDHRAQESRVNAHARQAGSTVRDGGVQLGRK